MKLLLQCVFSPRLYKVYKDGPRETMYQPQGFEKWGDKIISTVSTIFHIGLYTSPFIGMYLYKRGLFTIDEMRIIGRLFGGLGCILALSFLLRGYGRTLNTKYVQFIKALTSSMDDKKAYLDGIRQYDFEFYAWPVTYIDKQTPTPQSGWLSKHPFSVCANDDLPFYKRAPIQVLAYIATHTFGLRLIYPGSLAVVETLLWLPLLQGRAQLVEDFKGQRAKLQTVEGHTVDTMFVDNRSYSKGNTLVICCEGNSGYYEIGIMTTPIKAGYSVLGWNHPGFAGSSGLPYPEQEHYAIDVVMQYALNELGFKPNEIVMYGWSIGGYSATWAAVNYPVKGLVLDATFDDLLPLAVNHMPKSWSLLVKEVVRSYVDLNIAEMIKDFEGPVQLVRRTEDEIICLRQGQLASNRANDLVAKLIDYRHPEAVATTTARSSLAKLLSMQHQQRATIKFTKDNDVEGPLVPLISKYMHDYPSTHCTPLPEDIYSALMENIDKKMD